MIPDADIVALSTSVSNHWSRKSTALIVISWTWLYLSWSRQRLEAAAEEEQVHQPARIERRRIGRRHGEDRLDEPAHLDHRLAVFVVGLGVHLRVAGDLAARLRVIVDPPQVVAARHRREGAVERQDLEAVPGQIELADDLGPQQRHDVGADRVLEARDRSPRSPPRRRARAGARAPAPCGPARARYAALTSPLWPPPITMTS